MVSLFPYRCVLGLPLPLSAVHVSLEQFKFRQPLPHVHGFPMLKVLSADPTPSDVCLFSCFTRLEKQIVLREHVAGPPAFIRNPIGIHAISGNSEEAATNHHNSVANAAFLGVTTQSAFPFLSVYRSYIPVHFRYGLSHFCVRFTLIVRG